MLLLGASVDIASLVLLTGANVDADACKVVVVISLDHIPKVSSEARSL